MPCNSPNHIRIAVLAAIIFCVFNILPTLLLVLYPSKAFRVCLSKCRLEGIVVTTFVNKFHGCYRDDLDGGRDMRSLSGLYFFSRILLICMYRAFKSFLPSVWLSCSIIFLATTLLITYLKPYKKAYMNFLDVAILVVLTLLCLLLSVDHFRAQITVVYILALIPAGLLVLFFISKNVFSRVVSRAIVKQKVAMFCRKCFTKTQSNDATEGGYLGVTDSNDFHHPVTSTVVSIHEL